MTWLDRGTYQIGQSPQIIPYLLTAPLFRLRAWNPSRPESTDWVKGGWVCQVDDDGSTGLGKRILLNRTIFYRAEPEIRPYRIQINPPQYLLGYSVQVWELDSPQLGSHSANVTLSPLFI